MVPMQISKDRLELTDDLTIQGNVHPKHTMGRGMLRSHRYFEQLAFEPGSHAWWLLLNCFSRVHANPNLFNYSTFRHPQRSSPPHLIAGEVCSVAWPSPIPHRAASAHTRSHLVRDSLCALGNRQIRPTSKYAADPGAHRNERRRDQKSRAPETPRSDKSV